MWVFFNYSADTEWSPFNLKTHGLSSKKFSVFFWNYFLQELLYLLMSFLCPFLLIFWEIFLILSFISSVKTFILSIIELISKSSTLCFFVSYFIVFWSFLFMVANLEEGSVFIRISVLGSGKDSWQPSLEKYEKLML